MKNFFWRIFQNSGLIIISLGLLYGGVAIVRSAIPFWSLFYGLPAIFLGIVMSLVSFNEIAKNRIAKATEYHQIACRVCDKMTLAPMLIDSIVCSDCQYRMAIRLQMGVLVFLAILAIPVTFHLAQQAQDIRQKAYETICETGVWDPETCRCGIWRPKTRCIEPKLEVGRECQDRKIYCCENNGRRSACYPVSEK